MSRLVWLLTVCGLALAPAVGLAGDPKPAPVKDPKPAPAKNVDPTERLLAILADEAHIKADTNLNEVPLSELLAYLSKEHNLSFAVNEEIFAAVGRPNIKEERPKVLATPSRGASLHQFLTLALDGLGATYLVKNGVIEILPTQDAAKETRSALSVSDGDSGTRQRLKEPLVSAVIKEQPLNEVFAKLAAMYDLTVVVAPQAGDARTGFVTARLLNVPADKAIELLAVQSDLRVVRTGKAFLITSKGHAIELMAEKNELFDAKIERQRQKIELEKLRDAPAAPAAPPAIPPGK